MQDCCNVEMVSPSSLYITAVIASELDIGIIISLYNGFCLQRYSKRHVPALNNCCNTSIHE